MVRRTLGTATAFKHAVLAFLLSGIFLMMLSASLMVAP